MIGDAAAHKEEEEEEEVSTAAAAAVVVAKDETKEEEGGDDEDDSDAAAAAASGSGENIMATAFKHWRSATSPCTSADASPTKNKGSSSPPADPPSRKASIEKVGDNINTHTHTHTHIHTHTHTIKCIKLLNPNIKLALLLIPTSTTPVVLCPCILVVGCVGGRWCVGSGD